MLVLPSFPGNDDAAPYYRLHKVNEMKHFEQMLNFRHFKIKCLSAQRFQVTSPHCTIAISSVASKYSCVAPIFC